MRICKHLTILLLALPVLGADLPKEMPVIRAAAERNGIKFGSDDWFLLLAIRKSENGRTGREFGILNSKAYNLDLQAAWCACTIRNQHKRSGINEVDDKYIRSLAARYCPVGADNDNGTNRFWIKNVTYWYKTLKGAK